MSSWPHTFATQYPSVALSWLDDQFNAASTITGATLIGFSATATYAPSSLGLHSKGWLSVRDHPYSATGDGTTDDSSAIQSAENAASTLGANLYWPVGTYNIGTTTITKSPNVNWIGSGRNTGLTVGTVIKYAGTSDAIQRNGTVNVGGNAPYYVRDMAIYCTNPTAGKGCFADLASTDIAFHNVTFAGNDRLLILDQSELVTVERCDFELSTGGSTCGVWIVNGPDRTPGANGFTTNRIVVRNCQFNGTVGIGIVDDGGACHHFTDNDFNQMAVGIRAVSVNGLIIDGENEIESQTVAGIDFELTKLNGGVGQACSPVTLNGNFFSNASTSAPGITAVASAITSLEYRGNHFNTSSSADVMSTVLVVVTSVSASGNVQAGGGAAPFNNYDVNVTYTPTWSGGSPSIGNGTLLGSYCRNGSQVTITGKLVAGSTTTFGSGAWTMSLPTEVHVNNTAAVNYVGSVKMNHATSTYYIGSCDVAGGGSTLQFTANGFATQVGSTVPFTWASGDFMYWSINLQVDAFR